MVPSDEFYIFQDWSVEELWDKLKKLTSIQAIEQGHPYTHWTYALKQKEKNTPLFLCCAN